LAFTDRKANRFALPCKRFAGINPKVLIFA